MKTNTMLATAGAALAITMATAGAASAATYYTYLDWSDQGGTMHSVADSSAYGKVTINTTSTGLNLEVDLYTVVGFLNTGSGSNNNTPGNEQPFAFNTDQAFTVTVSNAHDPNPSDSNNQTFFYGGYGTFAAGPMGNFSDYIGCCYAPNNITNGSVAASPAPLFFTIQGATINDILSNSGHWWFEADVTTSFDGGDTFHVGAKDLHLLTVPEPESWALMILGFGAAGAMLRRRRTALA